MFRRLLVVLFTVMSVITLAYRKSSVSSEQTEAAKGMIYYVRQAVGNDSNDGMSPKTAWQHITKLSTAMHAGDTAYVGPGLYREEIRVENSGTAENRLVF